MTSVFPARRVGLISLYQWSSFTAAPEGPEAVAPEEAVPEDALWDAALLDAAEAEEEEAPALLSRAWSVFLPARPSAVRPAARWKDFTAWAVSLPNFPSADPERYPREISCRCRTVTRDPVLP